MKTVVYGSLMNQSSLESVVHRPTRLSKIIIPGWKRVFNAPFDGYAFLNLQPTLDGIIEAVYLNLIRLNYNSLPCVRPGRGSSK